ncbi:hypothetical protein [Pseudomonas sp. EA_35y_Pfl2_R111]|uniref:hypothetical protein n=1 Tax=Pseudomonas sp. EA_35y_Pfl2_R111 TaxID=3088689 RepID=UPI0030DC1D97
MGISLLRKLAIRLACIHAEDREWILAQLDASERQRIDDLLQEINLLGLAADPSVVSAVMAELLERPLIPATPGTSLAASVSRAEHPFWCGLLLQLQEQAQRRQLIDALPSAAAVRRWDNAFAKQPVPPALVQSLRGYLDGQLDGQVEGQGSDDARA